MGSFAIFEKIKTWIENLTDFLLPVVVVLDLVHHWSPSDDVRDRRPCCPLPRPEPPPPVEDSDGLRERFPTSSSLKVEEIHVVRKYSINVTFVIFMTKTPLFGDASLHCYRRAGVVYKQLFRNFPLW